MDIDESRVWKSGMTPNLRKGKGRGYVREDIS